METGLDSLFRNGKLVVAATVAAGVGGAHPVYAADAKDAAATTCMATVGKPHEVRVGANAPVVLQKLAASSLPKEGETRNPRAGRCDQVEDFTRLSVEHQQLVKDLYDKWRQDFSQLPEDNIVLAMSGVIKILARLPAVDEYLSIIEEAKKNKDDSRKLTDILKTLPSTVPIISNLLSVVEQKLGLKAGGIIKYSEFQPIVQKSNLLAATAQVTTEFLNRSEQNLADSQRYVTAMQHADGQRK